MITNNAIKNYSIRLKGKKHSCYYNIALFTINGNTRLEHYITNGKDFIKHLHTETEEKTIPEIRSFLRTINNTPFEPIFVDTDIMLPNVVYKAFYTTEIIQSDTTWITYFLTAKYDEINNTETYTLKQISTNKVLYEGSSLKECYAIIGTLYTCLDTTVWDCFEINGLYEFANRRETATLY